MRIEIWSSWRQNGSGIRRLISCSDACWPNRHRCCTMMHVAQIWSKCGPAIDWRKSLHHSRDWYSILLPHIMWGVVKYLSPFVRPQCGSWSYGTWRHVRKQRIAAPLGKKALGAEIKEDGFSSPHSRNRIAGHEQTIRSSNSVDQPYQLRIIS